MESQYLRIILLVIGGLIVLALIWDGVRRNKRLRLKQSGDLTDMDQAEGNFDDAEVGDVFFDPVVDGDLPPAQKAKLQTQQPVVRVFSKSVEPVKVQPMKIEPVKSEPVKSESIKIETIKTESLIKTEPAAASTTTVMPEKTNEKKSNETKTETSKEKPNFADDLIVLNVMAKQKRQFKGYELLQAILANGLRFGQMELFHRHKELNGQGPILFSLASVTQNGTFDMNNIGGFNCPGLTLFMRLPAPKDGMAVFDLMTQTARQLSEALTGDLLDDQFQALSDASIDRYKARIHRFEKGQMTLDLMSENK